MTTLTSQQRIGLVLLTLMWGLNWPIMKFSLRELPPLHFRALTMALPASTSAMSVMAVPLIGTLSAPLIVGEWPQWHDLAAMVCVLVAIAAVLLRRN